MTEAGSRRGPSDASAVSGLGSSRPDPASRPADPTTLALEAYIEASMAQLLQGPAGTQSHGLIFLSSWHEAMPALVHLDPVLDPVDSRVFAVLWIWAKQQGRGGMAFPSYDDLLRRCNVQSRSTLARSLAILRITRWVTLCRRVRDRSGRNRGNIYALHEEPLALVGNERPKRYGRGYSKPVLRGTAITLHWFIQAALQQGEPRVVSLRGLAQETGLTFRSAKQARARLIAWGLLAEQNGAWILDYVRLAQLLFEEGPELPSTPAVDHRRGRHHNH